MKKYRKIKQFIFLILNFYTAQAYAAANVIEPLSFGIIAIGDNSVLSEIKITSSGNTITTNQAFILSPGNRAEIFLSLFPPFSQLNTTATVTVAETTVTSGTTEQFTLTDVFTQSSVSLDATGSGTIHVWGTIRTSGNSLGYLDTNYLARYEVTIDF